MDIPFLNLLVRNVIESEIKREKVQMKPPQIWIDDQECLVQSSNSLPLT